MASQSTARILRSPREIKKMRRSGLIVWEAHQAAAQILKPGVTTAELNLAFRKTFQRHGATPLFLNYGPKSHPYPAETCVSINDEIVHGIPGPRIVQDGDIVSLDTGCKIDNWCGDAAITHAVGEINSQTKKLLGVTHDALNVAIKLMETKKMWSEVATVMMEYVRGHGFSVVEDLTGHGIGNQLHEPPQVPNYWSNEFDALDDFEIRPGCVIAVEPMVNAGLKDIECLDDNWTTVTIDGKCSAHFEHTVAITKDGPVRLTQAPTNDEELEMVGAAFRDSADWVKW